MANVFSTLVATSGDGTGPSLDVSALQSAKTAIINGTFDGVLLIEGSTDGTNFAPIVRVDGGANVAESRVLDASLQFLRARRFESAGVGTPTIGIGGEDFPVAGASCQSELWCPPETADPFDDEFDSETLDTSKWTLNTSGGRTYSQGALDPYATISAFPIRFSLHTQRQASWLLAQPPLTGAQAFVMEQDLGASPPASMGVWTRVAGSQRGLVGDALNSGKVSLQLRDDVVGVGTRVVAMAYQVNVLGQWNCRFSITDPVFVALHVSGNVPEGTGHIGPYMGIQKIDQGGGAAVYHGWMTAGGRLWEHFGVSGSTSTNFRFAALQVENSTNQSPGTKIGGFDFFRVVRTATFLGAR